MDPQQRLLLEHGYAALLAAGLERGALMGGGTGVFLGMWAPEYQEVFQQSKQARSVYAATAVGCSMTCGRVSFALGLQGPCLSIDTACSSGLVAAHYAALTRPMDLGAARGRRVGTG